MVPVLFDNCLRQFVSGYLGHGSAVCIIGRPRIDKRRQNGGMRTLEAFFLFGCSGDGDGP